MSREVSNVFSPQLSPANLSSPARRGWRSWRGGEVRLYCTTQGGDPTPSIVWRKDDVPMPAVGLDIDTATGLVRSSLIISQISSRDQASNISCTATNSDLVEPVTSTVTLQVIGEPSHFWFRF